MVQGISRSLTTIVFSILATAIFVQSAVAQDELSADDWRADLRFLQKTIHDDYSFLFKKITADQFDAEVEKLDEAIPDLQQHEVAAGLSRLVAMIGYGHTRLAIERSSISFHQIPVNLYEFNDGIHVQGVHKDDKETLGAKVIEVEGIPVRKALELIRPIVPAENDQFMKAYGLRYLGIPEVLHAQGITSELKNEIMFTLERDGKTFEHTYVGQSRLRVPTKYGMVGQSGDWLDSREQGEPPLYLKNLNKIYYFEYLPEHKTVYIRHSQILDDAREPIPEFYARVFEFVENNDVERLVLDVRLNGGGNNYKNKPIVTGVVRCEKINQPGKFFVITGRRTFSACQNLVNELDNYTNAVFVGEPTGENINFYGDTRRVVLPNSKIPAFLSFAWWQDKPQWENEPWLAPQVAVDMSFDDYRTNKDPALAAILEFSDDNFVHDPMEHLKQLFLAGKKDELDATARSMVNDSRYQHLDFEAKINQTGYDLMGQDQTKQAIEVFQFNSRLFPESANVWDSLAESYMNSGNKELAIKFYNKAIELDPDGATGGNARQMLERLNSGN